MILTYFQTDRHDIRVESSLLVDLIAVVADTIDVHGTTGHVCCVGAMCSKQLIPRSRIVRSSSQFFSFNRQSIVCDEYFTCIGS